MILQNIVLHLSLIEGLAPRFLHELFESFFAKNNGQENSTTKNLEELYSYSLQDFINLGCSSDKAQLLMHGLQNKQRLLDELTLIKKHHAAFVTIFCDEYPKLLKHIDVPPFVLYYQGDVTLFAKEKAFACVGARKSHLYVSDALKSLIIPMIQDDWVIVSGGALGADTYAHQITLDNKGKTIVVVGSGLCYQYPASNRDLFKQVVYSGGLIVSTFHMQMPPETFCFPIRNRIISGLSLGCLVLQAAQKSGALITAQCALQQGREVFALPGSIFDPLSVGCHDLIKQGAKLVTCTQDILEEMSYQGKEQYEQMTILSEKNLALEKLADKKGSKSNDKKILKTTQKSSRPQDQAPDLVEVLDLSDVSLAILHYTVVPVTAQALLTKVGVGIDLLQSKLFELSLDGKIAQDGMGFWKRV
jgi:DNA processing protein